MNSQPRKQDSLYWLAIICSIGAFSLSILGASGLLFSTLLARLVGEPSDLLYTTTTVTSLVAVGLASLPTLVLSGRAILGRPPLPPRQPSSGWLVISALLPLGIGLGHFAYVFDFLPVFLIPFAHILSATIPGLLAIIIVRRVGPSQTPLRVWGQLFAGLWGSPLFALVLEVIFLIPVIILLGFSLLQTETGRALLQLAINPETWSAALNEDNLRRIIQQPGVVLLASGYIALIVPIIEETIKTLAIWPFLRRGMSPHAAFNGGVIGGAGYALFEALFLTQPGSLWASTMIARIGATFMHSFTAGVASWGLLQLFRFRRWKAFGGAFLAAVGMHGLWNAAAIGIGFGPIYIDQPFTNLASNALVVINLVGFAILISLSIVALLGLLRIPKRLLREAEINEPTKPE
jgi:hypothetical protein